MYKLAIIDDEPLIQLGLHSLVHYEELSLVPCEFVNTGNQALSLIKDRQPDIVLLDIAMPNMDGISIIQHIHRENNHIPVFILLTNYDDFSYAQAAIRLDVSDFITKIEVNETVLNAALQKAILKVQERIPPFSEKSSVVTDHFCSRSAKNTFFEKLLNSFFSEQPEIDLKKRLMENDIPGPLYTSIYFRLTNLHREENTIHTALCASELIEDCIKKYFPCYISLWEADGIVCILSLPESIADIRPMLDQALRYTAHMLHRYINLKVRIGIGSFCHNPSAIPESFSESRSLCRRTTESDSPRYFSDCVPNDCIDMDTEEFHMCEYRDILTNAINSYDSQSTARVFNQISQRYFQPDYSLCSILSICFSLFYFTSVLIPGNGEFAPELFGAYRDPVESIRIIKNHQDALDWITKLRDSLCARLDENLIRSKNWLVPSIIDYINKNSNNTLSLQEVADAFDKSPAYISTLFKKHCNMGFSEYVRNAKLVQAKKLLANGYKIKDVADILGYSDPYYFSKIFKKAEHMSPSEYIYSLGRT